MFSVLLLCFLSSISIVLACSYTSTPDSTLWGDNMRDGVYGLSPDSCAHLCCSTSGCVAATWLANGGGCWLKSASMVASQPPSKAVGTTILWLSCSYKTTGDTTLFGENMRDGVYGLRMEDCAKLCCSTSGCIAATWVNNGGGCWLKSSRMVASQPPTREVGTTILSFSNAGTPPPPPPPTSSCKRGIAYGQWNDPSDFRALANGISWYYEWQPTPSKNSYNSGLTTASRADGVEFVPMIWGEQDMAYIYNDRLPAGVKYLLGFNEPNYGYQSSITPQRAAELWRSIQGLADRKGIKLVSPSVNYCGGNCIETDPFVWLDKFFAACPGCRVDYIGVHLYVCKLEYLKLHLGKYKKYGKPIWLTEFSCGDEGVQPQSVQMQYMSDALNYLDNEPSVFRYAWFSGRSREIPTADLFSPQWGVLNNLGNLYKNSNNRCNPKLSLVDSEATTNEATSLSSQKLAIGVALVSCVAVVLLFAIVVAIRVAKKRVYSEVV